MSVDTVRLALPLLSAGQAQKEVWHNEALALLDMIVQTGVVGWGGNAPPTAPAAGETWIVGASPSGAWLGHAGAIAGWTDDGWRFVAARAGMAAWSIADGAVVRHVDGAWRLDAIRSAALVIGGQQVVADRAAAIADPTGGGTSDAAARSAVGAILAALRHHGLIAS